MKRKEQELKQEEVVRSSLEAHRREMHTLKNAHAQKISMVKEMLATEQQRSNEKMERLAADIDHEREEDQAVLRKLKKESATVEDTLKTTLRAKYETELSTLQSDLEHIRFCNIEMRTTHEDEMQQARKEAAEHLEITVLRMATKHSQVIGVMEDEAMQASELIQKEREDFEVFMITERKTHLKEMEDMGERIRSEHHAKIELFEQNSLQMKKNARTTTLERAGTGEKMTRLARKHEIEMESMQHQITSSEAER